MKKFFNLLIVLILISAYSVKAQTGNQELPSVIIKDLSGKSVDLQKYAQNDKITIFAFWATWCAPCKKQLDNMSELLEDWSGEYDVELVAISIDNVRNSMKVRPYAAGKGWTFDVLLDENSDTQRSLNWASVPYTVVVDKSGKIVYRHTGYTEGDEFILEEKIKEILKN